MTISTRPQAVLFDLDGTLLDTLEDLADSMNAALARLSLPPHPVDAYRFFVGDGIRTLAERVLPKSRRNPVTIDQTVQYMKEEYAIRWDNKTTPYPGIPELLTSLTQQRMPMVILSNKPDAFTKQCVERFLPDWPFALVRGALDGVPIKPDPAGALRIAEELHIPAQAFLYLGDTNTDMRTACSAGMVPVGVTWGFRPPDELLKNGAQQLLDHPQALLSILVHTAY